VFQVYSPGATAATIGPDEDTWFNSANSFDLIVVSSFGPNALTLDDITLIASVPDGTSGSISVDPSYGADPVNGTYGTKSDALPDGATFNNHYPFQDDVSDFITFLLKPEMLAKPASVTPLHNYNASTGSTDTVSAYGYEYTYHVNVTGFTTVHFDVYGYETDQWGKKRQRSTWEINPGSHDVTAISLPPPVEVVPLPAALWGGMTLFGALGTTVAVKRRRSATLT
jgi:hypothetical protein